MEKELKQFILEIYQDIIEEIQEKSKEDYALYDLHSIKDKIGEKLKEII